MEKIKFSVIIPAYNESKSIKKTLEEVKETIKQNSLFAEIIVVNDGSTDNSVNIIRKISDVRLISHPYNKGYGAALKTGAKNASYDYLVYLDGDGQHSPDDIIKMLEFAYEYDMIIGQRTKSTSLFRMPAKKAIGWFANYLAGRKIPDLNSGFRIIKKDLVMKYINILPDTFSFTTTITLAAIKGGFSLKYVPIKIRARTGGKSTIHPIKDTIRFIMLLLRMTMLFSPLRVFMPAAFLLFIFGSGLMIYEIIVYFNVGTMSVMLVLSSMLVFFFGLLADQISQLRRGH